MIFNVGTWRVIQASRISREAKMKCKSKFIIPPTFLNERYGETWIYTEIPA